MSSTLFARGTNAQLGVRNRNERLEREVAELRTAIGNGSVQKEVAEIREKVNTVERKLDFQLANALRQINQLREELKAANAAIASLKTIITPPPTDPPSA
jgi:predicted  nucleic acid-binding Zn-ribbon protein